MKNDVNIFILSGLWNNPQNIKNAWFVTKIATAIFYLYLLLFLGLTLLNWTWFNLQMDPFHVLKDLYDKLQVKVPGFKTAFLKVLWVMNL